MAQIRRPTDSVSTFLHSRFLVVAPAVAAVDVLCLIED